MSSRKTKYNNLSLRAVEKSAPPNSIDIDPQSRSTDKDNELSYWGVKLVRRMIRLADEDFFISLPERDILYDVLSGKSIKDIASKKGVSCASIRNHVNAGLDLLEEKMNYWENTQNREAELIKESNDKEEKIQDLVEQNSNILRENHVLKDFMRLKSTMNPARIEVKAAQKKHLESHLNDIKIPPRITQKLFPLEIHTVYDLVRCTEAQLRGYEVFTDRNIESIKSTLKKLGFELGTDVRKVEDLDEYYIYPSAAAVAGSKNQAQSMEDPSVDELALKNKVMSLEAENNELQERLKTMEAEKTAQASELMESKDLALKYNALANHYQELYSEEKRQVSILKSKLNKSKEKKSPAKPQTEADNKIEKRLRSRIAELELLLARMKYEGRDIIIMSDLI